MSKNYRERRNARIIKMLTDQLGADFHPTPSSNRQFETLTTTLKVVGADRIGELWALAVEATKNEGWVGSPRAIEAAVAMLDKVSPVVEGVAQVSPTVQISLEDLAGLYTRIKDLENALRTERDAKNYV